MGVTRDKKAKIAKRAERLRDEVVKALRNRLCYPKTILGLLRSGRITEDQLEKMIEGIDESIRLIDAKFIEFMEEIKKP